VDHAQLGLSGLHPTLFLTSPGEIVMSKKTIGKEVRFLNVLLSGKTVSRKQAKSMYKLGNPSATVLRIQEAGYDLVRTYTNTKVRGRKFAVRTVKYSIG
jgi:hypothetical protein